MPIEEPTRPPKRPLAESGGAAAVAAALTVLRDKKAEPQRPEPVEVEAAIEPPPVVELPPVVDSPSAFERFAQAQSDLAAESAGEADVATEREAPPTPPSEAGGPDLAVFCADQFRAEQSSFDASRRFDEVYKGRRIRWEGKLERADKFSFDFVFGGDPGVMAVLEVFELDRGAFGGGKVQAVVRFPPEALESLRARIGERASFGGELLKCDAFMRKIYVADGRLD
jgi:hypothetical protein